MRVVGVPSRSAPGISIPSDTPYKESPMKTRSVLYLLPALAAWLLTLGFAPNVVAQQRPPTPTETIIACWTNTVEAGRECLEEAMAQAEKNLFIGLGMGAVCAAQYALDVFLCVPSRIIGLAT